jgi:hypothetical protein
MTKRIQRVFVAVAALAAMALGGAVLAQGQTPASTAPEKVTTPDRDNVQSGDQTTPDTTKAATTTHVANHTKRVASKASDPAGGGTGQSGNQTTPDTGASPETSGAENPETGPGSESAAPNDGPGGHADAPGTGNADHQFQGNE